MEAFFNSIDCDDSRYSCQRLRTVCSQLSKLCDAGVIKAQYDKVTPLKTLKQLRKKKAPATPGKCKINWHAHKTINLVGAPRYPRWSSSLRVDAWYTLKRNKHGKWKNCRIDFAVSYTVFNCLNCGCSKTMAGSLFNGRPFGLLCHDCSDCICGDGSFIVKRGACRHYFVACLFLRKKLGRDIARIIVGWLHLD